MADEAHHELIIVRRHEDEEHEHHSSAWKVAHADFMTAMMAFFLIMWLINVTDDQMRKGISEYFNPIHLSQGSTELKGLNQPDEKAEAKSGAKIGHSEKAPPIVNPLVLSQGHADEKSITEEQKAAAAAGEAKAGAEHAGEAVAGDAHAGAAEAGAKEAGVAPAAAMVAASAGGSDAAAAVNADARERAAFQDPYAVLAKLANQYKAEHPTSVDAIAGDDRLAGTAGGAADRDPFDPVYWQLAPAPEAKADNPGPSATAEAVPADALPDAIAANGDPAPSPDAKTSAPPPEAPPVALSEPPAGIAPATVAASAALETVIARSVEEMAAAAPEVSVKATEEGVLINLTDAAAFSMFAVGSAIPAPEVVALMEKIAKALAAQKGAVIVRGYTDGRPFHSDAYDNWRLSAARAHMAYYMLTRGGLEEQRVVAIEGHADRGLKNPADPLAAENRRIEIMLKQDGG